MVLDAWLQILTKGHGEVLYIDGFAGPGQYAGGEDGSPVIALKAALEHTTPITAEVHFIFVEARQDRAEYLRNLVSQMVLPANFRWQIIDSTFDETLSDIMNYAEVPRAPRVPTFVLVDPFGYSQTPFSLIARLMKQAKCEVLINFMYEEINRFLSVESQRTNFDNLFGSDAWRACIGLTDPEDRKQCIQDAYQRQLKDKAGIQFVRSFEMINDGRTTDYFLFFGTNNYAGLRAMKPATWRVDRLGGYQFSDRSDSAQPYLIEPEPNRELLKQLIVDRFKGTTFTETQLERFVVIETPFLDTHYKREILYQSLRMKS